MLLSRIFMRISVSQNQISAKEIERLTQARSGRMKHMESTNWDCARPEKWRMESDGTVEQLPPQSFGTDKTSGRCNEADCSYKYLFLALHFALDSELEHGWQSSWEYLFRERLFRGILHESLS